MGYAYLIVIALTAVLTFLTVLNEPESWHIPLIAGVVVLFVLMLGHYGWDQQKTQAAQKEYFDRENARARSNEEEHKL